MLLHIYKIITKFQYKSQMKFYVKVMLIQSVEKTIEIFLWFISISQSVAEI